MTRKAYPFMPSKAEWDATTKRIAELEEALTFYADPQTYEQVVVDEPYGETTVKISKGALIDGDVDELGGGRRARNALHAHPEPQRSPLVEQEIPF